MKNQTLLIAAAALVAGVISSEAQVYSANIVGYVNVTCPANTLVLASNPLDDGTNTANSILAGLPNKSSIQIFQSGAFVPVSKSSSGFTGNPALPVGTGFFIKAFSNYTNTFVGNVVPAPGGNTNSVAMPANTLILVGSVLPVGGNFNDAGTNTLNLAAGLPNKSSIQLFQSGAFVPVSKSSSGFTGNPAYSPATGFFIKAFSAANWTQTLQ